MPPGPGVNVTETLDNPADFIHGAALQVEQIIKIPTDVNHADVDAVSSQIAHANAAGMPNPAFATGMNVMQDLEILALQQAAAPLAYQYLSADSKQRSQVCSLATMTYCTHNKTPECIHCAKKVDKAREAYYHCCLCWHEGYPFDVCEPCLMKLTVGCLERDEHILHRVAASTQDNDQKESVFVRSTPVGVY
jgi:hypothetical protein